MAQMALCAHGTSPFGGTYRFRLRSKSLTRASRFTFRNSPTFSTSAAVAIAIVPSRTRTNVSSRLSASHKSLLVQSWLKRAGRFGRSVLPVPRRRRASTPPGSAEMRRAPGKCRRGRRRCRPRSATAARRRRAARATAKARSSSPGGAASSRCTDLPTRSHPPARPDKTSSPPPTPQRRGHQEDQDQEMTLEFTHNSFEFETTSHSEARRCIIPSTSIK